MDAEGCFYSGFTQNNDVRACFDLTQKETAKYSCENVFNIIKKNILEDSYITFKNQAYKNNELILILFILLLSSMLYSLIMANEGTFVRYRFTLFYPFLLAAFFITKNKNEYFK